MHYKSKYITPTSDNPFEYDLLDREKYANTLTQITGLPAEQRLRRFHNDASKYHN